MIIKKNNILLLLTTSFACGIWISSIGSWVTWGSCFLFTFTAGTILRRTPAFILLLIFLFLGAWRGSSLPQPGDLNSVPGYPCTLNGTIVTNPVRNEPWPSWKFTIICNNKIISATTSFPPGVQEGDRAIITAFFIPFRYGLTPDDTILFLNNRAKHKTGTIRIKNKSQIKIIKKASDFRSVARTKLHKMIKKIYPENCRGLAMGLFLGDKDSIPHSIRKEFVLAGTAHLLAISGLHIGLVAFVIYIVSLRLFRLLLLGRELNPKIPALILSCAGSFFYTFLSGFSPSALRASLVFFVLSLIILSRRRGDSVGITSFVVFLILFFEPAMLWSISLQLSVTAVFGILRFGIPRAAPLLLNRLDRPPLLKRLLVRFVLLPVRISAAAFIATLPVVLFHFGTAHPYALVANIAACPLLALTLVSGGCGLVTGFFSFLIATILAFPSILSLDLMIFINKCFSLLPFNTFYFPPFPPVVAIISFGLLFLPWKRVALISSISIMIIAWLFPLWPLSVEGEIKFDLTRGTATLLREKGKNMLMVEGVNKWKMNLILRALRIRKIDLLITDDNDFDLPIRIEKRISREALKKEILGDHPQEQKGEALFPDQASGDTIVRKLFFKPEVP